MRARSSSSPRLYWCKRSKVIKHRRDSLNSAFWLNLISLDVEVLNQHGEPVPDLKRSDFAIREDDKPREISSFAWVTGQPVSLTIILDTSAVTSEKLSLAKEYITLLAHLLAREDEIFAFTHITIVTPGWSRTSLATGWPGLRLLKNVGVTSGQKRTFFKDLFGPGTGAALSVDLALLNASKGGNERKALLVVSDRHKGLGKATYDHVRESGCAIFILSLSGSAEALAELEADPSDKGPACPRVRRTPVRGGRPGHEARLPVHRLRTEESLHYHLSDGNRGATTRAAQDRNADPGAALHHPCAPQLHDPTSKIDPTWIW